MRLFMNLKEENAFDDYKFLSLLESTLTKMLAYKLIWAGRTEAINTKNSIISIGGYSVLSGVIPFTKKDDFFATAFEVTLSDEFWMDFRKGT